MQTSLNGEMNVDTIGILKLLALVGSLIRPFGDENLNSKVCDLICDVILIGHGGPAWAVGDDDLPDTSSFH